MCLPHKNAMAIICTLITQIQCGFYKNTMLLLTKRLRVFFLPCFVFFFPLHYTKYDGLQTGKKKEGLGGSENCCFSWQEKENWMIPSPPSIQCVRTSFLASLTSSGSEINISNWNISDSGEDMQLKQ